VRAKVPEAVTGEGRVQAWVVGPGLDAEATGESAERQLEVAGRALASDLPVLVDAGGLDLVWGRRVAPTMLTPHAGELARLLTRLTEREVTREQVQAAPVDHARKAADATGATVLLKGATTLVVPPTSSGLAVRSQNDAPAWLATAGAGDVLAGLAGTLLAAGLDPLDAGSLAALVHGVAADAANPGGPVRAMAVAHGIPGTVAALLARGDATATPTRHHQTPLGHRRPGAAPRGWSDKLGPMSADAPTSTIVPAPPGLPACAQVDLDAISDNVATLRDLAGRAEVMAVVKADAYGHGLLPAARAALRGGATWLGVAQLPEAVELRRAGIDVPVLSWLHVPGQDLTEAVQLGIDLSVSTQWALDAVATTARRLGATARIHLKVDTGLGRNGAWGDELDALAAAIGPLQAEGVLTLVGVFSHFAYADAPQHPTVKAQQERFDEVLADLARAGLEPQVRHLANSAATLTNPTAQYDLVRPGLAVYGLSPVPDLGAPEDYGLREAMRLVAHLSSVKPCPAGQGISYGHTYTTPADTLLGLVPMGYADGIPRNASSVGPALVSGRRLSIAGRVCMDQFVLDLGADYDGAAGDEVVLFGRGAAGEPTAQDWAAATGTINYEIVTRVGARVPRVYLGAGSAAEGSA
jgi:alanine racemase